MSELLKNTSVIIRSSGERTEGLCRYAIEKNGVPKENIHLIKNEKPFSRALKKGYELAIELNKPYTFFIDADMVVMEDSLPMMLQIAERLPTNTFFINPLAYDCFSETILPNGPHLYRTKYLPEALKHIPTEQESKRPETYTTKQMYKNGYQIVYLDIPTAYHEFEQYYKDIFGRVVNKMQKAGPARHIRAQMGRVKGEYEKDNYVIKKAVDFADNNHAAFNLSAGEFDNVFAKQCDIEEKKPIEEKDFDILFTRMNHQSRSYVLGGYTVQLLNNAEEKQSVFKRIIRRLI
jgi:hypothetical protein